MKDIKVGVQLFTVRNSLKEDFEGTLRAIRDMGYEYVEFAGYYDKSAEEIKAILDELGLKCVSVHQRPDFFDADFEGKANYLKTFGVKYAIVPWWDKSKLAGSDKWDDTVKYFSALADKLDGCGMMLGYHNHDFEFETHEGKYLHDYIFEAIDESKIIPELDTCWMLYSGVDPAERIRKFSGRVPIVHFKDCTFKSAKGGPVYDLIGTDGKPVAPPKAEDNGFEFRPVGRGLVDFKSVLEACRECGTELIIVEQDKTYEYTELEAIKISRDYIRDTLGI